MKHLFSVLSAARSPRVPPSQDALAKAYANGFEDGQSGLDAMTLQRDRLAIVLENRLRAYQSLEAEVCLLRRKCGGAT